MDVVGQSLPPRRFVGHFSLKVADKRRCGTWVAVKISFCLLQRLRVPETQELLPGTLHLQSGNPAEHRVQQVVLCRLPVEHLVQGQVVR